MIFPSHISTGQPPFMPVSAHRASGFSLVEVTIALAIVTFGMVVLLGILPTGLNMVRESEDESTASNILSGVAADIHNTPESATTTALYAIPVWQSATISSGTFPLDANGSPASSTAESYYAVTWTILPPENSGENPRHVHVGVSWPANAKEPSGTVETLVGMERQIH